MSEIENALSIQNVSFIYKGQTQAAVKDFSLNVKKGSFTTLLGPSGCGKTTLLRCISGFLNPSEGRILINGIDQNGIEPSKRKIGMVFQDYALFPHLTVEANILYGLKIHNTYVDEQGKSAKFTKTELKEKVLQAAQSLDLQDFLLRYPHELSGGQQQRVALARALVLNPQVLLMDEPLSSLDTKLREKVRDELKEIQHKLGITTIYVTHDQEEALSLSDTIAVINDGELLQSGSPRDVYFKPASHFVADFVGRANILEVGGQSYMIRPEWFSISDGGDRDKLSDDGDRDKLQQLTGTVLSTSFLGDKTRFRVQLNQTMGTGINCQTMGTGINYKNNTSCIIIADLPTLESNFLEEGGAVSLCINHKWKL